MAVDTPAAGDAPPGRRQRIAGRAAPHRHLLAGSAALVVGAAVQAVTGALFWLVAARVDTTTDVGQATALFTSTLFIAYLAGLGLQVSLARFAPGRDHDSHATFAWGCVFTVLSTTVVSIVYVVVVDTEATRELFDWSRLYGVSLFVLASAGAALTLIVDVRWMTVRRWSLVLVRIGLVGLGRFPMLLVPIGDSETVHLFAVASLPLLISGFVGVATMPRVTGLRHRLFPLPSNRWAAVRYSAVNYLSNLTYQAPQFVLPVIVLLSVHPDDNAAFYVAWGIVAVGTYVPMAMGQALLAEGGKEGAELHRQVRVILALTVGLMSAAALVTFVGRDLVTTVYGEDYSEAARILPPLVAACVPWAVTSVFLTEARVLHRHVDTVTITVLLTASILVPALLLVPDDGLHGATVSFVIGNGVTAVVAWGFHLAGRRRVPRVVPEVEPVEEDLALHP